MKFLALPFLALALALAPGVGCDSIETAAKPATKAKKEGNKGTSASAKKPEPAAAPAGAADPAPAKPAAPKADSKDPSNDKEFLGLELAPIGDWKPVWDADAHVAKWENEEDMTSIVLRVVTDKLETIDDLKAAAPMMNQVGTAISSVDEDLTKTDKGWWTLVGYNDGKSQTFLYVRKFGASTVVCSARTKSSFGDGVKKDDAMKACESFGLKGG